VPTGEAFSSTYLLLLFGMSSCRKVIGQADLNRFKVVGVCRFKNGNRDATQ
jgi:hypothetical protein